MVLPLQFVETYFAIHPDDPNKYITVGRNSLRVSPNFKAKEIFNPLTDLDEHPISQTTINCVQAVRDFFNIPIRIESIASPIGRSYRNYPSSGANPSAHHLAQALDFNFLIDEEIEDELYLLMRDDFDNKGELFQILWNLGCRGFGSYDWGVHLDTVRPGLYPHFGTKRNSTYQSEKYGRWNKMAKLKYLKPSHYDLLPHRQPVLPPDGGQVGEAIRLPKASDIPPKDITEKVSEQAKKAIGSMQGFIEELLASEEDKLQEMDEVKVGYIIGMLIFLVGSAAIFISLLRKFF